MFKLIRRSWKYLTAKLTGSFNEKADPKVQLEQAITEAREQDRRLREQAANVIANQKKGELQLNSKMEELEKLNAQARQALLMADDATKKANAADATRYSAAAETIAGKLVQVEKDVESQKSMLLQATQASDSAKNAVRQNSMLLERKIAEKSKLLSQLDQAKMQEEMNKAMAQMNQTLGEDVPTFEEIKDKIEARYAKASATAELNATSVDSSILEIEQATADVEAQSRLSQLRGELGLDTPAAAPVEAAAPPTEGTATAQ
jgi:phage shock protein A